ncbi:MAG: ATP phosphoribosyltransferase regulatory subunit [Vallitaleaceae bacterium]|nr:ATP phosphoribosyltransferase regulatory subunit [Vallitaleaceae bacterium]
MKELLLHTPEGVRDIHLVEASRKIELQNRIMSIFHSYGFKDVQTPTFEYIDIFSKERGTVDLKMMYKFFDRDGNILALRPDITPSIARFIATSMENDGMPKRICYLGSTFRNWESYTGKLHEFTQAGVEFIGVDSPDADAEMIALIVNSMLASGLKEFQIDLGQASFFKGILEETGFDASYEEELRRLIDEKNYIAVEELLQSLNINEEHKKILLDLPKFFGSVEVVHQAKKMTTNSTALKALNRLEEVYEILKDYSIEDYIAFDLGMVSKINYYTGIVFRGFTYGTGVSVVDGGRYDQLLGQFGKEAPAVGCAFVIDDLMAALERQNIHLPSEQVDTLLLYNQNSRKIAIGIGESMRAQNMNIETGLLGQSLEESIAYGKLHQIGGIMNFVTDEIVELINLTTDEKSRIAVSDLFDDLDVYEEDHYHDEHCDCGDHEHGGCEDWEDSKDSTASKDYKGCQDCNCGNSALHEKDGKKS